MFALIWNIFVQYVFVKKQMMSICLNKKQMNNVFYAGIFFTIFSKFIMHELFYNYFIQALNNNLKL